MAKFSKANGKVFEGFDNDAKKFLNTYQWPGNVRQLENLMHSTAIMYESPLITVDILKALLTDINLLLNDSPFAKISAEIEAYKGYAADKHQDVMPLHLVEKKAIEQAIQQCNGSVTQAAALLEVNPSTLYRKIKNWESASSGGSC